MISFDSAIKINPAMAFICFRNVDEWIKLCSFALIAPHIKVEAIKLPMCMILKHSISQKIINFASRKISDKALNQNYIRDAETSSA